MSTRIPARAALKVGLLAGLLDISAAFIQFYLRTGRNPLTVLKFIASGLFGPQALTGGSGMMIVGLLLHFLIALSFALFFFWLATRLPALRKWWVLSGILYGLFVWAVMNLLVVPLSRTPQRPFSWPGALMAMAILVVCIGLPIAYGARKAGGYKTRVPFSGMAAG